MNPAPFLSYLLLPLSLIFRGVVRIRILLYRSGFKKVVRFPIPVIVVGNISVGGTGKTPLIIEFCQQLKKCGLNPVN